MNRPANLELTIPPLAAVVLLIGCARILRSTANLARIACSTLGGPRCREVSAFARMEDQRCTTLFVVINADTIEALETAVVDDGAVARNGVVFAA
jgi:hypothetical protein